MAKQRKKRVRRWSSRIIEGLIVVVAIGLVLSFFGLEFGNQQSPTKPIVIEQNGVTADDLYERAGTLIDEQDYAGALALVEAAMELSDTYSESVLWRQAWLLGALKRHDEAIAVYHQFFDQSDRPRAKALGGLCYNYASLPDFEAAEDYCGEALTYSSHAVFATGVLCYVHSYSGQYESAIEECNQRIENHPDHPYLYNNRGRAHLMMGNYWQAIRDTTRSIEMDNDHPHMTHANRGLAYLGVGRTEAAYADFLVALGADESYPDVHLGLGRYHDEVGASAQARVNYCRYVELA